MRNLVLIAVCLGAMASAAPQFGGFGLPQQQQHHQGHIPQYVDDSNLDDSIDADEKFLPTTPEPLIRKQFLVISPPEDIADQPKQKHLVLGRPQKNYRVVFIKAPVSDNANVQYSAEYAPQEDKTVIYVLSKKEKDVDASDIATPEPREQTKPDVFFIKYDTPEEAAAAQKEIQDEYDKLGGTNELAEETSAPIHSIVGSLDNLTPDGKETATAAPAARGTKTTRKSSARAPKPATRTQRSQVYQPQVYQPQVYHPQLNRPQAYSPQTAISEYLRAVYK